MSAFWSPYQIGLVFGFPNWHSVGIGLVLVWKFSESGITSLDLCMLTGGAAKGRAEEAMAPPLEVQRPLRGSRRSPWGCLVRHKLVIKQLAEQKGRLQARIQGAGTHPWEPRADADGAVPLSQGWDGGITFKNIQAYSTYLPIAINIFKCCKFVFADVKTTHPHPICPSISGRHLLSEILDPPLNYI